MFPLSNHYVNDALDINPAFAGCHDALSANIMYRNQWVGFKDSPKSYMLSVHTPIDYTRIDLGLLIENNSIGIFQETSFIGNYAFRMELRDGKLALGLGFGITVYNVAWNELDTTYANDVQLRYVIIFDYDKNLTGLVRSINKVYWCSGCSLKSVAG